MPTSFVTLTAVNIPDATLAGPGLAVSPLPVHGAHFIVTDIVVEVEVTHTFPDDLDMLLVAPDGVHNLLILSDAGGNVALNDVTLAFGDGFPSLAPDSAQLIGGYKPTNYDNAETPGEFGLGSSFTLNSPHPGGTATFGSSFSGVSPGGTWTLRVADDTIGNTGTLTAWAIFFFGVPVSLTNDDTNANGRSDVVWRDSGGRLAVWNVNGGSIESSGFVTAGGVAVAPDASWHVEQISDFNADDKADVLWRSSNNQLAIWTLDGSVITASSAITSGGSVVQPDSSWNVAATGDFGADGAADILWRNRATNELSLWTMNGSVIAGTADITADGAGVRPDSSWSIAGVGDFNADSKTDILWRNANGEVALWLMNGSSLSFSGDVNAGGVAAAPDSSWSVAGIGDFNSDGMADVLWRNTVTNQIVLWEMNGSVISASGDLTAGGIAVRPDSSWHIVEVGDFNGDHNSDILWRNDNGAMADWLMNGTTIQSSSAVTSNGTPVSPDGSWQVQSKPTNFG